MKHSKFNVFFYGLIYDFMIKAKNQTTYLLWHLIGRMGPSTPATTKTNINKKLINGHLKLLRTFCSSQCHLKTLHMHSLPTYIAPITTIFSFTCVFTRMYAAWTLWGDLTISFPSCISFLIVIAWYWICFYFWSTKPVTEHLELNTDRTKIHNCIKDWRK